jgi:hypothetical protein
LCGCKTVIIVQRILDTLSKQPNIFGLSHYLLLTEEN